MNDLATQNMNFEAVATNGENRTSKFWNPGGSASVSINPDVARDRNNEAGNAQVNTYSGESNIFLDNWYWFALGGVGLILLLK